MSRPAVIWLDAHLPPALAPWIEATFSIRCRHIRDLGLAASDDGSIIAQARSEGAAIMTKGAEFLTRIEREGAPPHTFLLTCGNTSNAHLMVCSDATSPARSTSPATEPPSSSSRASRLPATYPPP